MHGGKLLMQSMGDKQRSAIGGLAKLSNGVRANSDAKTQAGLSRGPNQSKKLNNAAWTDTFPAQGATLDLDFVNNRGYVRGGGQGTSMDAVTFTRASNGTFVKPDGTLSQHSNQGALGNNLLTFPQDFDNAAWTKSNSSIIPNTEIAPNGTLTANKLVENTANTQHYARIPSTTVSGVQHTLSCYLKAAERNWATIVSDLVVPNATAVFDLANEILGVTTNCTSTISNAGNGWYRCTMTFTTTASSSAFSAAFYTGISNNPAQSYEGNGTSGIYIWGAQLEVGSTATEYFPTNVNQPRFDWASTSVLAQRNFLRYSNDFSNTLWSKVGSITPNTIAAPAGLVGSGSSLFVVGTGGSNNRSINQSVNLVAGTTYTYSAYLKFGAVQPLVSIGTSNFNTTSISLDLSTGNITGNLNAINPQSIPVGDDWYRVSYSFIANTTVSSNIRVAILGNDAASNPSWFVYIYGFQLEEGAVVTEYQDRGSVVPLSNPLLANPTSNGLLIEISRANRILWCRDATQVGTNLVNYSEQFDNAFWAKTGILAFGLGSVANATTAPDGTLTADLVVENALTDFHTIGSTAGFPVTAVNGVYVASIYIKRPLVNGRRYFQITFSQGAFGNTQYATFDLQDGVVSGSANTVGTPVMTAVGDGWYRCSMAATATSTASSLVFFIMTNAPTGRSPSYLGDGVSGVYMWGAQVQETYLSDYVATTTAPIIGWRNTNITVAKNQTGIDGVANACSSLTATSANGTCIQTINLVSGSRTASVYLKRITGTGNIQVTLDGITFSTVELSTTEWRRIVLSGTVTIPTVGVRIATSGDAVAMDFAQVEDGTFATSPIMTTTATVTRAVDNATMPAKIWIDFNKGTFFTSAEEIGRTTGNATALALTWSFIDIFIDRTGNAGNRFRPTISGAVGFLFDNNANFNTLFPQKYKIAMSYNNSGASVSIFGNNRLGVAGVSSGNYSYSFGEISNPATTLVIQSGRTRYISRITYFPTKLTDTVVQDLSR